MTQRHSPPTLRRLAVVGLALATLAALPVAADANRNGRAVPVGERRDPGATTADRLEAGARRTGMGVYRRQVRNGARRLYVNPSNQAELAAVTEALHGDSNVLEILHMSEGMHSLALWSGGGRRTLPHFQYARGTNHWRLNYWGAVLRPSASPLYSAMIQLTPSEAARLTAMLAAAEVEQGPRGTYDTRRADGTYPVDGDGNTVYGHIVKAIGQRGFNCTSAWCGMPVGDNGETLGQIAGLRGNSGDPHGFQRDLETNGNERVFGIAVYGPKVPGFGQNPDADVTFQLR